MVAVRDGDRRRAGIDIQFAQDVGHVGAGRSRADEERRRDIAEATLALVVEKGHRAVVTAEIARRTGLSEPGVLYHFPSKDELLIGALQ